MIHPEEALQRLKEGNKRFFSGHTDNTQPSLKDQRERFRVGQMPFATILGCSDSRVPAEIIFDQGIGDLFVIRVAGNVVAPSLVGSVEFATEYFGTRLVVVLGHSGCGAVAVTLEALRRPIDTLSPNLISIVNRIRPAIEGVGEGLSMEERMPLAVRANIQASYRNLREGSDIIHRLVAEGQLLIVPAEYSLETGEVEFLSPVH